MLPGASALQFVDRRHWRRASHASRSDPRYTSGAGVQIYKGIPYAKPPVGDLRWRAPQPVAPWSGTRVADHFSPICVQPDPLGGHSFFTRLFFNPIEPRSEDCLYLNIWTTAAGGFVGGSAAGEIYGDAIRNVVLLDPADCPKMVTLPGSPPKAAMFCFTHCSAAIWSSRP
jgi:hypothetical protein